jgi:hypothetical protein
MICPKRDGGCGREFWREIGTRRRKCYTCSPQRPGSRAKAAASDGVVSLPIGSGGVEVPGSPGGDAEGGVQRVSGPIESAAYVRLQSRAREATPEGQLALFIAYQMESRVHSGSQLAAMSQELRRALEVALAGAPAEKDAVDEIADRRARRARGRGA